MEKKAKKMGNAEKIAKQVTVKKFERPFGS